MKSTKDKKFSIFEEKTGIFFKDKSLLERAFTHRSYINEHRSEGLEHNERLEFLGDAVLELVITDYLYNTYTDKNEGELTAYRAALVNTITLAEVGRTLEINDFLLMSKGEARDTGRARTYILANAMEALIGAIYIDQGYNEAQKFIAKNLFGKMEEVISGRLWLDAKSFFQEKAQEEFNVTPSYEIVSETGPDHNKQFTVGLMIGDELVAKGKGHSKQEAEQDAALNGLKQRGWRK